MSRSTALSAVVVFLEIITTALLVLSFVTVPLFKFTSKSKSSTSNLLSLSNYNGVQYGVFGYCHTSKKECSGALFNYKAYEVQEKYSSSSDWKLGVSTRKSVSQLLIVLPITAGIVFVNFLINTVNLITQNKDINENERFIFVQFIISIIFSFLSFAGAALGCIVVFLLFFPHVNWPAWILIPAAVLALACIPLSFFQYLNKKNEVYNFETGATMDEKAAELYGNNRLLSEDVVYEETTPSDFDDIDMTDDYKTQNFFTQLKKLGSENDNSISDLEKHSTAIQADTETFSKPSQLVDVMKNGSSLTLGTASNNSDSRYTNKKDSYNLYQEYKQNENDMKNESNRNNIPSKYDSAALNSNRFRDASGTSSHYTSANSYKQPGMMDRGNSFKTNDFKPESILFLDKKSPLENFNDIKNKNINQNIKEEEEGEVDGYSDISESDKDFVRQNIIPKSERPILESDDGLHDDQGSNFTSVSQRAGNTEYMQKRVNAPVPQQNPSFIPQQHQYQNQRYQPQQPFQGNRMHQNNYQRQAPMPNNYQYQQKSGPMGGFAGQPPIQGMPQQFNPAYNSNVVRSGFNNTGMGFQQGQRAPMMYKNNVEGQIANGSTSQQPYLQNNYMGGANFQPQGYKPGYKKKPMNAGGMMGPSSHNNPYTGGAGQQTYSGFR